MDMSTVAAVLALIGGTSSGGDTSPEDQDAIWAAMIDGTNTSQLFDEWWPTTETYGTRYERLERWFKILADAWKNKRYILRMNKPEYSASSEIVAMGDLANTAVGRCYTPQTYDANVKEWYEEDPMTWYIRANALSLADGTMNIVAVEGEDGFDITGITAPVYTFSLALYVMYDSLRDSNYMYKTFSTVPIKEYAEGEENRDFFACDSVLVDGKVEKRTMSWHATFGGVLFEENGTTRLTSGDFYVQDPAYNNHSGLISACGVSQQTGLVYARNWSANEGCFCENERKWLLDMWQLRHFDKENSGILEGCTNYNLTMPVTKASTVKSGNVCSVSVNGSYAEAIAIGTRLKVQKGFGGEYLPSTATVMNAELITSSELVIDYMFDDDSTTELQKNWTLQTVAWEPGSTEQLAGHVDGCAGSCVRAADPSTQLTIGYFPARIAGVEVLDGAYTICGDPVISILQENSGVYQIAYYYTNDVTKQGNNPNNDWSCISIINDMTILDDWIIELNNDHVNEDSSSLFASVEPIEVGGSSSTYYKSSMIFKTPTGSEDPTTPIVPWVFGNYYIRPEGGLAFICGLYRNIDSSDSARPRLAGCGKIRANFAP